MLLDLFSSENASEVPMPGADVRYYPSVDFGGTPERILEDLISQITWRQEHVLVWGKRHLQPRLVAWFGDAGRAYKYSGITLFPEPWSPLLSRIKIAVEQKAGCNFNSVLANYYRNGHDSMGMHSDNEPELGLRPTIASVSLGEVRTLTFKSNGTPPITRKLKLESGSLLLMAGDTQRNWKHGIAKEVASQGARVNLTFRRIIEPEGADVAASRRDSRSVE